MKLRQRPLVVGKGKKIPSSKCLYWGLIHNLKVMRYNLAIKPSTTCYIFGKT